MESRERQNACLTTIENIHRGTYIKEEGWNPNYVLVGTKKISRVNLIAAVIEKGVEGKELLIEDGTGKITVRNFNEQDLFGSVELGDIIILIGRPREFNNAKFIAAEIVKKIENPKWVEVRKKQIALDTIWQKITNPEKEEENMQTASQGEMSTKDVSQPTPTQESFSQTQSTTSPPEVPTPPLSQGVTEETLDETPTQKEEPTESVEPENLGTKILLLIKEKDAGEGVDIEEITKNLDKDEAERVIAKLILEGEIFEIKPGRVKVL